MSIEMAMNWRMRLYANVQREARRAVTSTLWFAFLVYLSAIANAVVAASKNAAITQKVISATDKKCSPARSQTEASFQTLLRQSEKTTILTVAGIKSIQVEQCMYRSVIIGQSRFP